MNGGRCFRAGGGAATPGIMALDPLVALLTADAPPRTWSVLVTVFGDLARTPGQEVGSPVLGRLGEAMGLRPEAVRTALHRLHREGWLARRRQGRHSLYALTARGRVESDAAGPRIYGPQRAERAFVVLTRDDEPGLAVAPTVRVSAVPAEGADVLCYPAEVLPDWMRAALLPPETAALAREVRARFDDLDRALRDGAALDPLRVATLRVLVVHLWRRVALRLPELPDAVLPAGSEIAGARARFGGLLARLPAPDIGALA